MKYESSILKRLIDTYGVIGNPRYLSEIIKEFIVRGKELYPQLFTYQADWLAHIDEFGLTPDYVVSYTGQQIYAPHTKERPVKRAILKGSTKYRDIDTGEFLETFEEGRNLELVSVKMPVLSTVGKNLFNENYPLENRYISSTGIWTTDNNLSFINLNYKTTNQTHLTISFTEKITILNQPYVRIAEFNKDGIFIKRTIISNSGETMILNQETDHIILSINKNDGVCFKQLQIEFNSIKTPYEPYKSNILTVNEPVELRGIGEVQDTLDCLTGEVTERIGEVVLDGGNISFTNSAQYMTDTSTAVLTSSVSNTNPYRGVKCNKLPSYKQTDSIWSASSSVEMGISGVNATHSFCIRLPHSLTGVQTTDDFNTVLSKFKTYLQANPITVQYELATESVKTVDLTVKDQNDIEVSQLSSFNGGTHFSTSSQLGSLNPMLEVDVVTDLEETLNLCSMDGNTL